MTQKSITINMSNNNEPSPIAMLVQLASQYKSSIYIHAGTKRINAKSIMGMMTLCLNNGESIDLVADGPDEQDAVFKIDHYLTQHAS